MWFWETLAAVEENRLRGDTEVQRGWPRLNWRWRDGAAAVKRRKGNVAIREVCLMGFGDWFGDRGRRQEWSLAFPRRPAEAA